MKIINDKANLFLWNASKMPLVGFVTGPVRALGGVIQAVVNLVASIFLIIPSLCGLNNRKSKWHAAHFTFDCAAGIGHVIRGAIETIPFTSLIFKHVYRSSWNHRGTFTYSPYNDRPFETTVSCKKTV